MSRAHSLFLGIMTGVLLCGAHGFWAGLSWLAPVPLLYGLVHFDLRSAFYAGLLCGFFESLILFGLSHAGPLVFGAVALLYALSRALFCVMFVSLREGDYLRLLAPALWVLFEWGQAQIPFTLPNLLGDTFDGGDLFGVIRLGGTYLLSGLVVWAGAIGVRFIREGGWHNLANQSLFYTWLCVLCVCQLVGTAFTPRVQSKLPVTLIQGGIPTWIYERGQAQILGILYRRLFTRSSQRSPPPHRLPFGLKLPSTKHFKRAMLLLKGSKSWPWSAALYWLGLAEQTMVVRFIILRFYSTPVPMKWLIKNVWPWVQRVISRWETNPRC